MNDAPPAEPRRTVATRWIVKAVRAFGARLLGGALLGGLIGALAFALLRAARGEAGSWLWLPLLLLLASAALAYVGFGAGVRAAARVLVIDSGLLRGLVQRVQDRGLAALGKPRFEGVRGVLGDALQPLYRTLLARLGVERSLIDQANPAAMAEQRAADWIAAWRRGREWIVLGVLALVIVLAFVG